MKKPEIDHILARMLDSYDNVSDLNITVGKPFQVESSGQLVPVEMDPPFAGLTPFQGEIFALFGSRKCFFDKSAPLFDLILAHNQDNNQHRLQQNPQARQEKPRLTLIC